MMRFPCAAIQLSSTQLKLTRAVGTGAAHCGWGICADVPAGFLAIQLALGQEPKLLFISVRRAVLLPQLDGAASYLVMTGCRLHVISSGVLHESADRMAAY
jgi:hypothetical protein